VPSSVVLGVESDDGVYILTLYDGQRLTFNGKEVVYPTSLVAITTEIKFLKNAEVAIEFRVNPSNAIFNYDVSSPDCRVEIDAAGKLKTYSYVTNPDKFRLTRIEQVSDADGNVTEGQYRAYIRDNNGDETYKYATAVVLTTKDKNNDTVRLSSAAITVERKANTYLPVVAIYTENRAEIEDKENWIRAKMTIDGVGKFDDYEGTLTIRGRGNSTWDYPKKPYAIKLDDKSEILGMPTHKRWVLLANYMDRTLMRNEVAFDIARCTGLEWTPRGQFVEVVLNDVHLGNFYLCEHIKIDKNRVNIAEMKASDIDAVGITGGYLLELDLNYDEVNQFRSATCDLPVMLKEPEEDVLQPAQFEYIRNYINSFERCLYADDFAETREYASYIDETSFIDWWLVMELTMNNDPTYPHSCYFYKDRTGVLKAGPVWDFDRGEPTGVQSHFSAKYALWFPQLFKDPVFVSKVRERWIELKPSFDEVQQLRYPKYNALVASARLNDEMWSLHDAFIWNGDERMTFRDAIEEYFDNYAKRLKWLDQEIRQLR